MALHELVIHSERKTKPERRKPTANPSHFTPSILRPQRTRSSSVPNGPDPRCRSVAPPEMVPTERPSALCPGGPTAWRARRDEDLAHPEHINTFVAIDRLSYRNPPSFQHLPAPVNHAVVPVPEGDQRQPRRNVGPFRDEPLHHQDITPLGIARRRADLRHDGDHARQAP